MGTAQGWLAGWLDQKAQANEVASHDSEALAALATASSTGWWIETVYLETANALGRDRAVEEWVATMLTRLRPSPIA